MEGQFQFNWSILVEEAKVRRKNLKLTQFQLAQLANVSAPTISRFENGEKDIQLSSIMKIFEQLGMVDQRYLIFLDDKPQYDNLREIIFFFAKYNVKKIKCGITREALEDHFFSKSEHDLMKIYMENRMLIQQDIRKKFLSSKFEDDGSIIIISKDLYL